MNIFKDKVAIITGGASGIGRALCKEMARQGSKVVIADIDTKGTEEVASAISDMGGEARAATLDVRQRKAVENLINETVAEYGRLDYMFNNAGIATLGEVRHMTPDQWRRIIDINLYGVIYGTTTAYSIMVKQGFGHIVNTSSHAGLHPVPGTTSYALTKHGVVGLSTSLRAEGADLGVKVTVLCPGPVKTNILNAATLVDKDAINAFDQDGPSWLFAEADDAAKIILKGIGRNQAIIVFPTWARIYWWLYRLFPAYVDFLSRLGVRAMRRNKN